MPTAAHSVADPAENPEDEANDHKDDSYRPQDAEPREESNDQQNDSQNDHDCLQGTDSPGNRVPLPELVTQEPRAGGGRAESCGTKASRSTVAQYATRSASTPECEVKADG
ncbi:hypothetical protein GCM10011579_066870 [Streptomyces albiflavescens]|uniref:Uncharacterized protein n=1 Tax=Streptomyces albiflavescens TaxID=1623582 RepID=A0A918D7G6_9ACTN|nr:hypothetical protein GCM10011579_066870 [Streptomyces albiflavescens]